MFEYLMTFKKSAVSPRTFEGNIRNFKLHIAPLIGKMKVYEIDSYAIQKLVNSLIDQGYSNDTIKKCKHLLNQFFEYSIDNKWILVNPTLKVKVKGKRIFFSTISNIISSSSKSVNTSKLLIKLTKLLTL